MRRGWTGTMVVATAALLLGATGARAWYPFSAKYTRWQKDRPFMMAGLHNATPRDHLPERVARFKAGGMNTFMWAKPGKAMHFFREAHAQGLAWSCWHRGGPAVVAEALKIPGCAFIMTGDEPDNSVEQLAEIAEFARWVRANYPDIPQFVNLSIAEAEHDRLIAMCEPDIFSFDCYPMLRNGRLSEDYLYAVMWGRRTARKHKVPYWIFLQCYGREQEKPTYAYRIPDEADIRFLIFTHLAHGGTGLMWFIYYGATEAAVRDVVLGDDAGRKPGRYEDTLETRAWWAIRDAAAETHNLARALINLRSKDPVGYVGRPELWDYEAPGYPVMPADPFRLHAFEGHGALRSAVIVEGADVGLLVGFFDDKAGAEYFMVVNLAHGLNMSKHEGRRKVRLRFDADVSAIERLNRVTGRVEALRTTAADDGQTSTLDVFLPGGTGDLFKWADGTPWDLRPR